MGALARRTEIGSKETPAGGVLLCRRLTVLRCLCKLAPSGRKTGGGERAQSMVTPLCSHGRLRHAWRESYGMNGFQNPRSALLLIPSMTTKMPHPALVAWLAGVHDIGKATPGFQYKVLERAELVEEMGLRVPRSHMMNRPPSHANMGEVLLENWLDERGWDYSRMFGSIIGAHHGSLSFLKARYSRTSR